MFNWYAEWGRIEQEEVIKGGKKRPFLGSTSPPKYPVACPHATTSIILNPNLVLSFVREERRSCRGTQAPLLSLRTLQYFQHRYSSALVSEKSTLYGFAGHQMRGNLNFRPNQLAPHSLIHPT